MNETPLPKVVRATQHVRRAGRRVEPARCVARARPGRARRPRGRPSRRRPSARATARGRGRRRVAERLLAVEVDQRDEVGAGGGRRTCRLPDRALVALGVAQEARSRGVPSRWRRPASAAPAAIESPWPSEPVEKSTPCSSCSGCAPSRRAVAAVGAELVVRSAAAEIERGVQGERGVALGEHEAVAVRVAGSSIAGRRRRARRGGRRWRAPSRCGRPARAWTAR